MGLSPWCEQGVSVGGCCGYVGRDLGLQLATLGGLPRDRDRAIAQGPTGYAVKRLVVGVKELEKRRFSFLPGKSAKSNSLTLVV